MKSDQAISVFVFRLDLACSSPNTLKDRFSSSLQVRALPSYFLKTTSLVEKCFQILRASADSFRSIVANTVLSTFHPRCDSIGSAGSLLSEEGKLRQS